MLIVKAMGMTSYDQISQEVPSEWLQLTPHWQWDRLGEWGDTAGWVLFVPVIFAWIIKGAALGVGGPQQLYDLQRFLAVKTPREASLAGMIWSVGLTPMYMVAAAVGVIGIAKWGGQLSNPVELYPVVIGTMLPVGLKGLVLAGLLSAFMSTFSATVNAGASYLTHDLYQKYVRPDASDRHLVAASRVCSLIIVVAGIIVGMLASNINMIFEWIMMVLGTGVLMPNVLRWFWWRFNGTGFAVGTLVGVGAALACAIIYPTAPSHITFPILLAISLFSSVLATYASSPTDMNVLKDFYRRIQPAGAWGPVRRAVEIDGNAAHRESFAWDAVSALITAVGLQALYLISTYAVTHQWSELYVATAVVAICAFALYFTWYRRLPLE
jgi:Na+/proline symporter